MIGFVELHVGDAKYEMPVWSHDNFIIAYQQQISLELINFSSDSLSLIKWILEQYTIRNV